MDISMSFTYDVFPCAYEIGKQSAVYILFINLEQIWVAKQINKKREIAVNITYFLKYCSK